MLLGLTVALFAQRRWQKRRRVPQKSASTEATHEIHYIPSVLLGPQAREGFRSSRRQAHGSVIGVPIRETPILDDYDCEEEEDPPRRANHVSREDEFGSQVTHALDSLGRPGEEKGDFEKKGESFSVPTTFREAFWGPAGRRRACVVGVTDGVFWAKPIRVSGPPLCGVRRVYLLWFFNSGRGGNKSISLPDWSFEEHQKPCSPVSLQGLLIASLMAV